MERLALARNLGLGFALTRNVGDCRKNSRTTVVLDASCRDERRHAPRGRRMETRLEGFDDAIALEAVRKFVALRRILPYCHGLSATLADLEAERLPCPVIDEEDFGLIEGRDHDRKRHALGDRA